MMTVNDVLMKFFKLPPGVKMMMALLGFGSLATVFFAVKNFLWPMIKRGQWLELGIIAGVLVAGLILVWIVMRMRRRASAKKGGALEGEISKQEAVGDATAREQQKANRDKFQDRLKKLKELDKNVYDLPWYILLGEPACGKSASLRNSGIDFPLGVEEVEGFGGTRNYNWWFANDAIILDTAGRLAFHEEGTTDRPEWEGFLQLMRKNRPSCPINGVVLAIPANALLSDSSEERNQKATMLRERLRQLAQSLGVRFPVYLLITKADLVAGFSEFFDEFKQDVPLRKQMLGWSRPGEFQQTYDPVTFGEAFDAIYLRLRDWAMRYLQRPVLERDLGMIVTYPEAFRALKKPLDEYVSKIFQKSPLVEPPFFRGFYFTSACQEGAPIMNIFEKSHVGGLKTQAVGRAPDSKPFFIQSVYEDKVFQEKGLTFRSSKDVAVSRRTRTLVWSGCAAMLLAMGGFFWYGSTVVNELVTKPENNCKEAVTRLVGLREKPASVADLAPNAELAKALHDHQEQFKQASWLKFKMLFIGANPETPRGFVEKIYTSFAIGSLLKPVEAATADALAKVDPAGIRPDTPEREKLLSAVEASARWFAEAARETPEILNDIEAKKFAGDYRAMLRFVGSGAAVSATAPAGAAAKSPESTDEVAAMEVENLLKSLSGQASLGKTILIEACSYPLDTRSKQLITIIDRIKLGWTAYARLSDQNANDFVKYWFNLISRIEELKARYGEVLALGPEFAKSDPAALKAAQDRFLALTEDSNLLGKMPAQGEPRPKDGTIAGSLLRLMEFLTLPVPQKDEAIIRLKDLFAVLSGYWTKEFARIEEALNSRLPETERGTKPPTQGVYEALRAVPAYLAAEFENSKKDWLARLKLDAQSDPLDRYAADGLLAFSEKRPNEPWPPGSKVEIRLANDALGAALPQDRGNDRAVRVIFGELREIVASGGKDTDLTDFRKWPGLVQGAGGEVPDKPALLHWFTRVKDAVKSGMSDAQIADARAEPAQFSKFWRAADTFATAASIQGWRNNVGRLGLMRQMRDIAAATVNASDRVDGLLPVRGLGRLMPEWNEPAEGLTFLKKGAVAAAPVSITPKSATPQPAAPTGTVDPFAPVKSEPSPVASAPASEPAAATTPPPTDDRLLRKYHTRTTLTDTFKVYAELTRKLESSNADDARELRESLNGAAKAYLDDYFGGWNALYNDCDRLLGKELSDFIAQCRSGIRWDAFARTVGAPNSRFGPEIAARLSAFKEHVAQFDGPLNSPQPSDIEKRAKARILEANLSAILPDTVKTLRDSAVAIGDVWAQYTVQVRAVKWPEKPEGRATVPNVRAMAETLGPIGDNRLAMALLAIAKFGNDQLRSEVEDKFRQAFAGHAGSFPFGDGAALSPQTLETALIQALEIEADYSELLRQLSNEQMKPTLDACAAWRTFLWGGKDPKTNQPLVVDVTVNVEPKTGGGYQNLGEVYKKMTYTLPLEGEAGGPMQKTDIDLLDVNDFTKQRRFRFNLRGQGLPPLDIFVRDKNASVAAAQDPASIVRGGSNPLEFLKILDKSAGGQWRRTWDGQIGADKVGCDLKINVGAGTAAYPGTIPMPSGSTRPPDRSVFDICK